MLESEKMLHKMGGERMILSGLMKEENRRKRMKLFKSTDEKLRDLGFIKTEQSGHGAFYVRQEPEGYGRDAGQHRPE